MDHLVSKGFTDFMSGFPPHDLQLEIPAKDGSSKKARWGTVTGASEPIEPPLTAQKVDVCSKIGESFPISPKYLLGLRKRYLLKNWHVSQ